MKVELSPKAVKYLQRLKQPMKGRIVKAIEKLSLNPPQGDIRTLEGRDGYRLRVGDYRLLFDIIEGKIIVHDVDTRGQVYRRGH